MNAINRYGQTQKQTASPERLMVMLFEAALRHMRTAISALESGRVQEANMVLAKATDIVVELQSTLNRGQAPELCEQLGELYIFVSTRLLMASSTHQAKHVREAERVFAPIVEGFQNAVRQITHREVSAP